MAKVTNDPRADEARAELIDEIASGTSNDWFNRLDQATAARTGGKNLTELWQTGNRALVEQLLDEWHAASRASAERYERDPRFLALVEARRAAWAAQDAEEAQRRVDLLLVTKRET